jgi:hypothetical protein
MRQGESGQHSLEPRVERKVEVDEQVVKITEVVKRESPQESASTL